MSQKKAKSVKGRQSERAAAGRPRKERAFPIGRSPALEAARQRAGQQSEKARGQTTRRQQRMSNAAEASAFRYAPAAKKRLPPMQDRLNAPGVFSQLTEMSEGLFSSRKGGSAVQDIESVDEDELEKLRELDLELRLPRVPGKFDSVLLVVVLLLLMIGLIMVYSASSFISARAYGSPSYFFQRQLISALLGVIAMLVTMRIDYRIWRRFSLVGMAIVLPLLVLVLVFGTNAYGASRWFTLGPLSFQPSELTKLALSLYIADWLARKGNQVRSFLYGLTPFVLLVGLILGLVLLENDMGTAIVIAGLATAMFFTAGANIAQFLLAVGCGLLVFVPLAFRGYRFYRILGFLNPLKPEFITNINLQLYQSLLALGSGGFFGLSLGASRQKTGYLPFPHIDSIFAILGEELGFVGGAIVIVLFLALAFRGFRLARRTQDVYGALLATGLTTWLVLQAAVNIGASTASVPYTGVPLPFISYGGTSLIVSLAAVGVLLNISRYIQEPEIPLLSRRTITETFRLKRRKSDL